jgi:hypothetical protein
MDWTAGLQQCGQFAKRLYHRDVRRTRCRLTPRTRHENATHAQPAGTFDIVPEAVSHHHRCRRFDVHGLQG